MGAPISEGIEGCKGSASQRARSSVFSLMVPLFVAHGTRDGTILAPDLFVIEALRQQPTRSLRYVVVENGDHAFETAPGQSRIPEMFDDFLDWALDAGRITGTAVLH